MNVGFFSPAAALPATDLFGWPAAPAYAPSSLPAAGLITPDLDRFRDNDRRNGGPDSAPVLLLVARSRPTAELDAAIAPVCVCNPGMADDDAEEEEEELEVPLAARACA